MKGLANVTRASTAAIRVALFAGLLVLAAGTSYAQHMGRGGGGSRGSSGSGRSYSGGGRGYSSGARSYSGGSRSFSRSYAPSFAGRGVRGYAGPSRYYGGYHRVIGHYPYGYRYHPHSFVSFGIGVGVPYYYPDPYPYYVPYPVEVESPPVVEEAPPAVEDAPPPAPAQPQYAPPADRGDDSSVDVTNEPPPGCYYYDPFSERRFANLDEYTAYLETHHHQKTIEVLRKASGNRVRTLEFVNGYWGVQREPSPDDSQ